MSYQCVVVTFQGMSALIGPFIVVYSTVALLITIEFVHCFLINRRGGAKWSSTDFRNQRAERTKLYSRVITRSRTNVIRMIDTVTKVSKPDWEHTQSELRFQIQVIDGP